MINLTGQVIIDETYNVKKAVEQAYDGCLDWLFSISATIVRVEKPYKLVASHKGVMTADSTHKDWPKLIAINIQDRDPFSVVNIQMKEPEDNEYISGIENRKLYWGTMLNGFQEYIGMQLISEDKVGAYPVEYFLKESSTNIKNALGVSALILSGSLYLLFSSTDYMTLGTGIIGMAFSILFTLWCGYKQFKINREYSRIYPNTPFSRGRLYLILLLILIVSGPMVSRVFMSMGLGTGHGDSYDEFNEFGFSFMYPSEIEFEITSNQGTGSASNMEGMLSGDVMRGLGQSEGVVVRWYNQYDPAEVSMIDDLYFDDYMSSYSDVQQTSIGNYIVYHRQAIIDANSTKIYVCIGTWHIPSQDRSYFILYLNTKQYYPEVFIEILNSFEFDDSVHG